MATADADVKAALAAAAEDLDTTMDRNRPDVVFKTLIALGRLDMTAAQVDAQWGAIRKQYQGEADEISGANPTSGTG